MKNYIWDFDGTLFDSYPHLAKAFCLMLEAHNREYKYEEVIGALEISFDHAFERYLLSDEEIREFKEYAADTLLMPLIVPYEAAEGVLENIARRGGKNYIYTHRNRESTLYYLNKYGLSEYFEDAVTSDDGFARKPAPDGVRYIIERYDLSCENTVMIGDREIDVLSGINAGVFGCLIKRGKNIQDTRADYVFEDLSEIELI